MCSGHYQIKVTRLMTTRRKICLVGYAGCGKTTIARHLRDYYMYGFINFTDYLKVLALNAINHQKHILSLSDMIQNKEDYRTFLVEYAKIIGFQTDTNYIDDAFRLAHKTYFDEFVVFDNARTKEQANHLKAYGFSIVRINMHESFDMSIEDIPVDVVIENSYTRSIEDVAKEVIGLET